MRAIELRLALAALALVSASVARAEAPPAEPARQAPTERREGAQTPGTEATMPPGIDATPAPPKGPFYLVSRTAPPDIASFPAPGSAIPPPDPARAIEFHGYVAAWFTPVTGDAPDAEEDAFRLRFAVLRVDAKPLEKVTILTRLGLMVPGSPLLDAAVSYTPHEAFGVTAGQFRLPIGAAATTLAPLLVMLDRPSYVYAMTKLAFRDVGAMIHSGPEGIAGGLLHYRLMAANGGGRILSGDRRPPGELENLLYAGRVMFDPSRLLFGAPRARLVLGASYARSHDPAIATGDPARDRSLAANTLGRTLVQYDQTRTTQLAGGDVTFQLRGFHAQGEVLYLHSEATGAGAIEALGASLELAYTLPYRLREVVAFQLATRGERFDPRRGADDEQHLFQLGLNVLAGSVRGSVFGTLTAFDDATGENRTAGELTFRMAAVF